MKKNSRGFSLVEAVVAMAIILLISAAVLSMILSAARAQSREAAHHAAAAHLADIVTVYRVSDTEAAFADNLAFALGLSGMPDLANVPLSEGYTANIAYSDAEITVTVNEKESMRYTFRKGVSP